MMIMVLKPTNSRLFIRIIQLCEVDPASGLFRGLPVAASSPPKSTSFLSPRLPKAVAPARTHLPHPPGNRERSGGAVGSDTLHKQVKYRWYTKESTLSADKRPLVIQRIHRENPIDQPFDKGCQKVFPVLSKSEGYPCFDKRGGIPLQKPSRYFTVKGAGQAEIHIQKSQFISRVNRVETEEEAVAWITEISKRHWDATHNCYAYSVLGESKTEKASDDGEPAGTAGRPILEVIKARELVNTAVVVTRYFGGIKLGAGGLVRAYSQSASTGLDAAGTLNWVLHSQVEITVDYPAMGKVEHALRSMEVEVESPRFDEQVHWRIWVPVGQETSIAELVAELTSGRGRVTVQGAEHRPLEV